MLLRPSRGHLVSFTDCDTSAGEPPGGPITGGKVVPSSWRNPPQSGPILLAGDSKAAAKSDILRRRSGPDWHYQLGSSTHQGPGLAKSG
jgi:hypothetical protein